MNAWLFDSLPLSACIRTAYNAGEMWIGALSGRENWIPTAFDSQNQLNVKLATHEVMYLSYINVYSVYTITTFHL